MKIKRMVATILSCSVMLSVGAFAAASEYDESVVNVEVLITESVYIAEDSEYYFTAEEILSDKDAFFLSDEVIESIENGDTVLLGGVNAPVSELVQGEVSTRAVQYIDGWLWYTSYATYSSSTGVQVYFMIYSVTASNPKFRSMNGTVYCTLRNMTSSHTYSVVEKSASSTISTTVSTGRTQVSGTSGTVEVYGVCIGDNIATNAGIFSFYYDIKIP